VLFSGLTVAIGLLALVVLPVPFLRSIGYGGVLIPLISVGVAVTLLPVLLATAGPRLDWPRLRTENTAGRGWTAWAAFTVRRRGVAAVVGMAALGALIFPALSLQIGEPRTDALAQSGPAHDALGTLTSGGVPSGVLTPITVLTTSGQAAATAHRLAALPGVDAALAPNATVFRQAGTALITVLPTAETNIGSGQHTVRAVRGAIVNEPGAIGVDGSGASMLDFAHDVYGNFPLMLALIALATFVLLARAFRPLVLPAKAVLLNLASLAAAYGVMVLVWQQGHLSHTLWGIPATGSITMWVPVMVFAFLFGLSMDYEVFILARMREAYDATGSTKQAVTQGIGRTGRLVTSAALILFLSFVAMSTGPQTDIKVLATGLGAGTHRRHHRALPAGTCPGRVVRRLQLVAAGVGGAAAPGGAQPAAPDRSTHAAAHHAARTDHLPFLTGRAVGRLLLGPAGSRLEPFWQAQQRPQPLVAALHLEGNGQAKGGERQLHHDRKEHRLPELTSRRRARDVEPCVDQQQVRRHHSR